MPSLKHRWSRAAESRRQFWNLLRRELEMQQQSYRFWVAAVLILGLMTISAWIHTVRYQAELVAMEDSLSDYNEQLEGLNVAALVDLRHPAFKPPWRFAFLVEGGQTRVANVYSQALSPWMDPVLSSAHGSNPRLPPADALDWLFLIRVVASLAAFVLAYDSICGKREHATLKITLSYPVGRLQVLLAKVLAIWIALVAPLLVGGACSLLLVYGRTGFSDGIGWGPKIALVTGIGAWSIGIFVLIGVMISALNREAERSLAVLALVWVSGVVVIPAASGLLALALQPVPTSLQIAQRLEEIKEEVYAELGGPGSWRGRERGKLDDYIQERQAARTQARRLAEQDFFRKQVVDGQFRQLALTRTLASLSPMTLVQDLAERVTGSGPYRDRAFLDQAWAFRPLLGWHLLQLDQKDSASPHIYFAEAYLSEAGFDPAGVPRFQFREATVGECLQRSWWTWLLLLMMTGVILALTIVAFARYDVG